MLLPVVSALCLGQLSVGHRPPNAPQPWSQYGGNPQHTALSSSGISGIGTIRWQTPVDEDPQYSGNDLLIHYGTPLVELDGTVVVPVKTGASGDFAFKAFTSTGVPIWTVATDYTLPDHRWTPPCSGALVGSSLIAMPASGGTVLFRAMANSAANKFRNAFYGLGRYNADKANYDSNVKISTPLTVSPDGTVFFGFVATGSNSANLSSGIARMTSSGLVGKWVSASEAAADAGIVEPVMNCAPAVSLDGKYIYVAVSSGSFGYGYLLCLDSRTLQTVGKFLLVDPDGRASLLPDDGTASPMVGPDGDVYFGVLENPFLYNHDRGWMLHFDSTLRVQKPTGAFGWDDTASVVPANCVPSYTGNSSYLILTKYNNYAGAGGNGINKVGILDPNDTMTDPISGYPVMKEVITVAGPTPDPEFDQNDPGAVREWCINSAAIDPINRCAVVNSEDGTCYRWDFTTNTLTQSVVLTPGVGEAYTPTAIGPNGLAFAINNGTLFVLGPS